MKLPECVVEVVGELEEDLAGKVVFWGFEPSGRLHKGHLNPVSVLNALAVRGAEPLVFVADLHAELNGKQVHDFDALKKYLPKNTRFIRASELYSSTSPFYYVLELSKHVNTKRAVRATECAGRGNIEGLRVSALFYALLQAVDAHLTGAHIVVGGTDQRKVHMLMRDTYKKLGWYVPTMIHTKLLLGKDGKKMSSSNEKYCEFI